MTFVTRARCTGARELALFTCIAIAAIAVPGAATAQSLPAPWSVATLGGAITGAADTADCGTDCLGLTLTGSGAIRDGADAFTFVHRTLTGNGAVTARLTQVDAGATAGVMIRQSLSPQSPHAFIALSAPNGVSFQRRTATAGRNWSSVTGTEAAPVWLKIERQSSTVTASQSMDGINWRVTGQATITFPEAVLVGFAVVSGNPLTLSRATFSRIGVQGPPLPAGWASTDIGGPDRRGTASYYAGRFSVSGGGTDIYYRADQFHFAHRQISGNFDLVARVLSLESASAWTKSGVMIRGSLAADSAHAFMLVSPSMGLALQSRPDTGLLTLNTSAGAGKAPIWIKLERRGSLINAYRSPDGAAWTLAGSEIVTLPDSLYAGLAVTSHAAGAVVESLFDNVTITTVNAPPAVSLTAPANGSSFGSPASFAVTATASDSDGTVARVRFYAGATLIGTDTTAPYSITWNGAPAGSHTIRAVAEDNAGATTTSPDVRVDVRPPNRAPTVSLSAPGTGALFASPAVITVTAAASDADGQVTRVELYAGAQLLASDTAAPYTVAWNAAPGSYALTAIAYDDDGAAATSPAVMVTVQPPVRQWRVAFGLAADHATNVDGYVLELFKEGATAGTALRRLELGKPAAGQDATVDMTALVSPLAAGRYVATISAFNLVGSSTRVASAVFVR